MAAHALAPPALPGRAAPALAALAPWGEEAARASEAPARWGAPPAPRALAAPGRRGEEAARASAALERRGVRVLPQAWAVQAPQLGEEEAARAWATPASAQVSQAWAALAWRGVLAPRVSAAPAPWGAAAARALAAPPAWQGAGTPPPPAAALRR